MLKASIPFLFLLLVTDVDANEARIKGHIKPLQEELLEHPVALNCGVNIVENVEKIGGKLVNRDLTKNDITILNNVCSNVVSNYIAFVSYHKRSAPNSVKTFSWNVSLLPDTRDYRCLNDTRYRFYSRVIDEGNVPVDGYTDLFQRHTFSLSNRRSGSFKTVFAHEIFHAINAFYGISDTEKLAEEFTEQLGYGR